MPQRMACDLVNSHGVAGLTDLLVEPYDVESSLLLIHENETGRFVFSCQHLEHLVGQRNLPSSVALWGVQRVVRVTPGVPNGKDPIMQINIRPTKGLHLANAKASFQCCKNDVVPQASRVCEQ